MVAFTPPEELCSQPGYFQFGPGTICYGQSVVATAPRVGVAELPDLLEFVEFEGGSVHLPFDPVSIIDNLRMERYRIDTGLRLTTLLASKPVVSAYYALRPHLPVWLRKTLQQIYLSDFRSLTFPTWPLDDTIEQIHERLLLLSMKMRGLDAVPFIWFWPDGASASAIVTHDVETAAGLEFVEPLMKLDSRYGIQSSFQLVPEKRYQTPTAILEAIRLQGCEVNIQGLDHDGDLFRNRGKFREDCRRINEYVRAYHAAGFRSPSMYRNADWLEEIDISYDMSFPTAAHLEPQRGGCCTVFPYFIGRLLELPLTMVQDYSLFHILENYSIAQWKSDAARVLNRNGLISFIIHPDYILDSKPRAVYEELLSHLVDLRTESSVWIALPGDVNRWWRQRDAMRLEHSAGQWQIVGQGRERARVAFAYIQDGRIAYSVSSGYQATGI